ncbi:uncharacterized protein MAM_00827 [Metarhizium album ARSEF 1941]|uniref:Histidinolphosphatase-like protein n=1 Tax=Metarhizium album (strain ARSEF 1941) TaxID=1081103 RepID=A0A0B2X949_METAS|nr:uncharacterized protein MAM_00827 [Metarhizium album ARSEF 1941]KHO01826.1 hypothetical protein MAM_00827 [Metarhizium album ARSEF 1941]
MAEQTPIVLELPSKYTSKHPRASSQSPAPDVEWLAATWTVTHSTLHMWRSSRNVRITYTPLPSRHDGRRRIDDLVEYEPTKSSGVLKTVAGVDTQSAGRGWDWRGKGWLFFVSSHWEVLGWGEVTSAEGKKERWAVTWFAPTVFTKEGLDVYCDSEEGLSEETYLRIQGALKKMDAKEIVDMVDKNMRAVEIKLPRVEK